MVGIKTDIRAKTKRILGFPKDSEVVVRQIGDKSWSVVSALRYSASRQDFEVKPGAGTDFASVPRFFVWFLPRYGRYTKAAILHDYLWREVVGHVDPVRRISRRDADGIFLQAMRELGVPFLRRWIMWASVRWAALFKSDGRRDWWRDAWRVVLMSVVALPVVAPPAVLIALALLLFFLMEMIVWLPLWVVRRIRRGAQRPAKAVNQPRLRWTL